MLLLGGQFPVSGLLVWDDDPRPLLLNAVVSQVHFNRDVFGYLRDKLVVVEVLLVVDRTRNTTGQHQHLLAVRVGEDRVLDRVPFLLPRIVLPLFLLVFWPIPWTFGSVNDDLLHIRELLKKLFDRRDFPFREVVALAENGFQDRLEDLNPCAGSTFGDTEEEAGEFHRRIDFQVEQDEKQHPFGGGQRVRPTSPQGSLAFDGRVHLLMEEFSSEELVKFLKLLAAQAG